MRRFAYIAASSCAKPGASLTKSGAGIRIPGASFIALETIYANIFTPLFFLGWPAGYLKLSQQAS